jgi:predicted lipid-binding transport protein (Tim44 family)
MKKQKLFVIVLMPLFLIICLAIMPDEVLARAGGGGGGGKGGIVTIILLPFIMIYSAIMTYMVKKKNEKCKSLLKQLSEYDSSWDIAKIKAQVETAFFTIQKAWMERDQNIAKEFMSERLYLKHKMQTDQMIANKRKNRLERINLKEAKIVEVADFEDDSKDRIWVFIHSSMVDYIIDEEKHKVISGDELAPEEFTELWKFVKNPQNRWVLDEIDQKVRIGDLTDFLSFSDELKIQPGA